MTYARNIARLKETSRANLSFSSKERLNAARDQGDQRINEARDIATKLSGFSNGLYQWKLADIKEREAEGKLKFEEIRSEKAEHALLKEELIKAEETAEYLDLTLQIEEAKKHDVRLQELKAEMLRLGGVDTYPEADRVAKLSEHQQVGYLKAKLGSFAETYSDKLGQSMQNSTQPIKVGNVTFTSAQLRENHISALPLKEAAMRVHSKNIMKAAGLEKFSPEMLALSGVTNAMATTHKSMLTKYRSRYNIDASHNERMKYTKTWQSIPPKDRTAFDLYQLFLGHSNTVDGKNNLLGNAGGWDSVFSLLTQEGIAVGNTAVLDKYRDMVIPENLRKSLGLKPGTKFGKHWDGRFAKAEQDIMAGVTKKEGDIKKYQDAGAVRIGNMFTEEVNTKGHITDERLKWYENQSYALGGKLDERIKNYKTLTQREMEDDIERIEDVMASNNGYIDHATLNTFHPRAALKYRKDADRHEAAMNTKFNVDKQIKAALNQSWTDAGMKQNEKSVVWEFAFAQAKEDYQRQFNFLVANGYTAKEASRLALRGGAGEAVDKESGDALGDFEGVISNIDREGANSKYTRYGEDQQKEMKDGHLRVQAVDEAKKELQTNPYAEQTTVIGGKYGRDRLNEIKESIEKHGVWDGLRRAENALDYYEGVALGKRGMFAYGLIDAQLKADGHPGIFPNRMIVTDSTGQIKAGTDALQPTKYRGSGTTYNNVVNDSQDLINYYTGKGSVFNDPENLPDWLGGTE